MNIGTLAVVPRPPFVGPISAGPRRLGVLGSFTRCHPSAPGPLRDVRDSPELLQGGFMEWWKKEINTTDGRLNSRNYPSVISRLTGL